MNRSLVNSIVKRVAEFNDLGLLKKYDNVKAYCEKLNLPIPFKRTIDRFLINEYYSDSSPIRKGIKFPVKKRRAINRSWRKDYEKYLLSTKWKEFKAELKRVRSDRCEGCGKIDVPLDGHHLTYERLFNELPQDVLLLCRLCHEKVHQRKFNS